jgi:D-alanine-D-alanine ligase-like ATP-grasp enzyme
MLATMVTILMERWRAHPLAWIHRAEARSIARELRAAGEQVRIDFFGAGVARGADRLLVRVSDPVMLAATRALSGAGVRYCGPGAATLARCYDKYQAYAHAAAHGIDVPPTLPAADAQSMARPLVLKPRRGSDSIGLRLLAAGPIPARYRSDRYLAQDFVRGRELTVALLGDEVGMPLAIGLEQGTLYTFWRKYLWPPHKAVPADCALTERVRVQARRVGDAFGIDWAARVDFMYERETERLLLLECDAAPLVGARSAFAASMLACGMERAEQLRRLTTGSDPVFRLTTGSDLVFHPADRSPMSPT